MGTLTRDRLVSALLVQPSSKHLNHLIWAAQAAEPPGSPRQATDTAEAPPHMSNSTNKSQRAHLALLRQPQTASLAYFYRKSTFSEDLVEDPRSQTSGNHVSQSGRTTVRRGADTSQTLPDTLSKRLWLRPGCLAACAGLAQRWIAIPSPARARARQTHV